MSHSLNKIYIVKVKSENIKAYSNKSKAQEHADELNKQYESIVDLDVYVDAEIYVSNDIMNNISTYDGFYEFTNEMIKNIQQSNVNDYKSVEDAWNLLEDIYAAHKDMSWHDFVYSLLYHQDGSKQKYYSYWFAILLKIFCKSVRKYTIEELRMSVEIYQENCTLPHAYVEELEYVDDIYQLY